MLYRFFGRVWYRWHSFCHFLSCLFLRSRLRYFHIRKYESIYISRIIKLVFMLVSLSCVSVLYGFIFDDSYHDRFLISFSFVMSSVYFCLFLFPIRLAFLMFFSVPIFSFLYLLLLSYVAKFSFLFWGIYYVP